MVKPEMPEKSCPNACPSIKLDAVSSFHASRNLGPKVRREVPPLAPRVERPSTDTSPVRLLISLSILQLV